MKRAFHNRIFDEPTLIKLDIFRHYVREWLPVFLTKRKDGRQYDRINVYDLFSGPGTDAKGTFGSPLIVQEEIKAFCGMREGMKADVPVRMIFNDIRSEHIADLKENILHNKCPKGCCEFKFSELPFDDALRLYSPEMRRRGDANLVILDQFGVTGVTPKIVKSLVECGTTDVMFFISTSYIRRFADEPEIRQKISVDPKLAKNVEYNTIHRFICDHFRGELRDEHIYLAPFSIKNGKNIYGVIFASAHLSGLEHFLKVCWALDQDTGQANYNIDKDISWDREVALFPEYRKSTKIDLFEQELVEFIISRNPDNLSLYRFCLECGFPSSKANEILRGLQKDGRIQIVDIINRKIARKNSFYLTDDVQKVIYRTSSDAKK